MKKGGKKLLHKFKFRLPNVAIKYLPISKRQKSHARIKMAVLFLLILKFIVTITLRIQRSKWGTVWV